MLKQVAARKESSLAEQGALAAAQGEKGEHDLWKKGQVTQKESKGIRVIQG